MNVILSVLAAITYTIIATILFHRPVILATIIVGFVIWFTQQQFTMVPNKNTIICFRCVDAMRVNQKPFLLRLFFICVSLAVEHFLRTFWPARFHFVPLCLRVHAIETSCNLIVLLSCNPFAAYYERFFRKQRTCNYLFRRQSSSSHTFTSSISNSIHRHTPSSETNTIACNLLEEPRRVLIDGGNSNHHHHRQIWTIASREINGKLAFVSIPFLLPKLFCNIFFRRSGNG